ncbi:MAG: ABC transporter ATP-binding protein [Pseudomonadota bacterium]
MARIALDAVAHSYEPKALPRRYALERLDMVWEDGGTYALLGPSGCGKTTMLNIISGLVTPTEGRVMFGARDVTRLPTPKRNIAQVFQFPVIYASMTVRENLAFPLVCRRVPRAEIAVRVAEVAELLGLSDKLEKAAVRLTADEKQLISLGRGLVRNDVSAILMDEPLTVIDPQLKFDLRRKLKQVNRSFGLTLVYVTHDQNEAMTFADTIVVMSDGRVVQSGSPQDLFERPQTRYVGYFIGSPAMNFLDCRPSAGGVELDGGRVALRAGILPDTPGEYVIGIRPEFASIVDRPMDNALPCRILDVEDLGNLRIVTAAVGRARIKVKMARGLPIPAEAGWVVFPPERVCLYRNGDLVG